MRLLRLSAAGGRVVDRLAAGQPVPQERNAQRLARRLVDAGLAHPCPRLPATGPVSVTIVIPVRDRPDGLEATLAAVTTTHGRRTDQPDHPVVVVDDASLDPASTDRSAAAFPTARVVHRTARGGPGRARQTGWRQAKTDVVAFVDADCTPTPGWLDGLLPHFADPTVAAVAPRIVPAPATRRGGGPRALAAYEHHRSPLDLGGRPAPIRPGGPVPYVPTAALLVRRSALIEVGGFDPNLPVGEDVDLVWRLLGAGWRLRYEPAAAVVHPTRTSLRAAARQRYDYGTSAALLGRRHGASVAPLHVSPWNAAAWAATAWGHPLAGLALAAASAARLLRTPMTGATALPVAEAARLAAVGHWRSGWAVAEATRRAWWPVAAAVAVASRRSRPALAVAAVGPPVVDWVRQRPALDPLRWTALYVADDLAYGAGVWAGAMASRSGAALRPRWRRTPGR